MQFFVPDLHSGPAAGAVEGVIAEGEGDGVTPLVQGAVFKEEVAEFLRYGEDAVAVGAVEHLQGDGGGTLTGIEGDAGRAEAAVTAEGDMFLGTRGRADAHGGALCGIPTVDKPGDVVCLGK